MTAEELQKIIGYIVGSSVFTAGATKVLEFVLNELKERSAAKRAVEKKPPTAKEGGGLAGAATPIIWQIMGDYAPEGNVVLVELVSGDKRITITCEACMVRGQARQADQQNMQLTPDQLHWFEQMRQQKQPVYYPDVALLPPGGVHDYFDYYEVRSAYYAGLFTASGRLFGVLGITSPEVDFLNGQPRTGILQQVQHLQNLLPNEPAA